MDQRQYSTLMDALSAVPDPRKARGKQYSWLLLLTLICSALGSGERSGHGIANWVAEHATSLLLHLRPARGRLPSEATLRRALRRVDVSALEQRLALYTQPIALAAVSHAAVISEQGEILQGQALDGKAVRGATAHGQPTHLVSLVQHASALTLAQVAVEQLALEITAAPILGFLQGASQNWLLLANLLLLLKQVQTQDVVEYFHSRFDKRDREGPTMAESVLNKVTAFTFNPYLKHILGASENWLDFKEIMNEGKVLVVDLARCDPETRRLVGSLVTTDMEMAAMSRIDEVGERKPFYLFIDEFQDFSASRPLVFLPTASPIPRLTISKKSLREPTDCRWTA